MSRVDIPTLRCDRCEVETKDLIEMARFQKITHYHTGGHRDWDLCPPCWAALHRFLTPRADVTLSALRLVRDGLRGGTHLHHDGEHWVPLPYVLDLLDRAEAAS